MDKLDELYMELLIEHATSKLNMGSVFFEGFSKVEAFNPLCGDKVVFRVSKSDSGRATAKYECSGCAISRAAASMSAQAIIDALSVDDAKRALNEALQYTKIGGDNPPAAGDWVALGGVAQYPMRVKCATMSIRAAIAALDLGSGQSMEAEEE